MNDLTTSTTQELIDELRSRSACLVVGMILLGADSKEDTKIYLSCKNECSKLEFLGLGCIIYADVTESALMLMRGEEIDE